MKLTNLFAVTLAAGLLAGCATVSEPTVKPDPAVVDPVAADAGATDQNPYANYAPASKSTAEFPLAVVWQDTHKAEVAEGTKPEALAAFIKDDAAAAKLLAGVKEAYAADPLVMMQIAGVSQLVMTPGCPKAAAGRVVWVKALLKAAKEAPDAYRALIFLDQLRWCGRAADADAIRAIGKASKEKSVAEFADWVVREITR